MNQARPVREQMKALQQLQELDLRIDAIKRKKAELPISLKSATGALNQAKQTADSKKNSLAEIEKSQRQTQAALDLNRDRLVRANSKLESVHNSQEFQAANKEIDQLKKMNLSLEEQLKKLKQDSDVLAAEVGDLETKIASAQEELDKRQSTVTVESERLETEIQKLNQEKGEFLGQVERRVLALYDRVRIARGGVGIVLALGGRCSGCNMMVPPQLFNEVQKANSFQSCPSCHRILCVPNQVEPNVQTGAGA